MSGNFEKFQFACISVLLKVRCFYVSVKIMMLDLKYERINGQSAKLSKILF